MFVFLFASLHLRLLLRQVARAGRFGTKGLAITFVSDETDAKTLNDVQDRFEVNVAELPDEIDISSYSKSTDDHVPNDNKEVLLVVCHADVSSRRALQPLLTGCPLRFIHIRSAAKTAQAFFSWHQHAAAGAVLLIWNKIWEMH